MEKNIMRRRTIYLIRSAIISVFVLSLSGCASKPNISILDENYAPGKITKSDPAFLKAKSLLFDISKKSALLAKEVGRLPEMLDGITPEDVTALEHIVELYNSDPAVFDNVLKEMV